MNGQSQFRPSRWVAGSLCGLVVANLFLALFVAGVDVFLGQPPQLVIPLFALLIAAGSLVLGRRRSARAERYSEASVGVRVMTTSAGSQRGAPDAPAYVAMTIIKRPLVFAQTSGDVKWKGAVQ
jgi:hypothetical protein